MKTLYVTDLDGTLLNGDAHVSRHSASLLNEAIESGALISVATARTPATVSCLLKDISLQLPLVVFTGAAMWLPGTMRYEDVRTIYDGAAHRVVEEFRRADASVFQYVMRDDGLIHVYHYGNYDEQQRQFVAERVDSPFKFFEEGEYDFSAGRNETILFFAMQPDIKLLPLYESLKGVSGCRPTVYNDNYGERRMLMEIFSPQASKADAVMRLKKMVGADRLVVFGDNVNDLTNFEIADVAVAVGNAIPEVRGQADIIIEENTEDSVARFILHDFKSHHD